jgi:hypothetical protein
VLLEAIDLPLMDPTNLFGLDVSGLDVHYFEAAARALYPLLALLWLALLLRIRRPGFLLLGVLLANGYVFLMTTFPLQRLYGLGPSGDRLRNLGMCQVVAAGNSPLETWQVGQTHFEPYGRPHNVFWVLFVSALAGFDPERVFVVYGFLPLLPLAGVPLALYYGLAPRRLRPQAETPLRPGTPMAWCAWERALIALSATLLFSMPLDFLGVYRVPWALMFLLKPNHALGLVVVPLVLRAVAAANEWRGRIVSALLLNLLAWIFVLHAAYVVLGLLVFAGISAIARAKTAREDAADVQAVLGLSLLPLLLALVAVAPSLAGVSVSLKGLAGLTGAARLPAQSPHLLEPIWRSGGLFILAVYGAWVAATRGDRLGRLLVAQLIAGGIVWVGYLGLSVVGWAEQSDEVFYWLRYLTAVLAGVGAWHLASQALPPLVHRYVVPATRAAILGLLLLPWTLPYWWDPERMDLYFMPSREPLPAVLSEAGRFLRSRTQPEDVLAGDRYLAPWMAALGARRSILSQGLPRARDAQERSLAWQNLLVGTEDEVRSAAAAYGVRYLVVTPEFLKRLRLDISLFDRRVDLERVFVAGALDGEYIAFYRLVPHTTPPRTPRTVQ